MLSVISSIVRIQTKPFLLFSSEINFKDCFLEVIKEFCEDYRTLITHLRPLHIALALHIENVVKATVEK